jgi:hypothetical protein
MNIVGRVHLLFCTPYEPGPADSFFKCYPDFSATRVIFAVPGFIKEFPLVGNDL